MHEYERPQFKVSGSDNKRPSVAITRPRVHRPTMHQHAFNLSFSKDDLRKRTSNSKTSEPAAVRGKNAELQTRCKSQLRPTQTDRNHSCSEELQQNDSDANFPRKSKKISWDEVRAASPFNTLLLPPAYKLSTSRIVGRRALSASPFDRPCALGGGSITTGSVAHFSLQRRKNKFFPGQDTDGTNNRRPKSAIPIGNERESFHLSLFLPIV